MTRVNMRTNIFLLVLLSALCTVTAVQWFNPPQLEPKPIDKPVLPTAAAPDDGANADDFFKIAAENQYSEIIERPLFLATRRPPPPEPEVVTPIEDPPEEPELNITLIGVMVTPQTTTVLLKDEDEGKVVPLKLGESINNWELESVQPERVVLRKSEDTKELLLVRNKRKAKSVQKKERLAQRKEKLKERRLAAQKRRGDKRRRRGRADERDADTDTEADTDTDTDTDTETEADAEADTEALKKKLSQS